MLIFQEKPGRFSSEYDKKDNLAFWIGVAPPGGRKSSTPRGKGSERGKRSEKSPPRRERRAGACPRRHGIGCASPCHFEGTPPCHSERSEESFSAIPGPRGEDPSSGCALLRMTRGVGLVILRMTREAGLRPPQGDRRDAKAPGHPVVPGCPGALFCFYESGDLIGAYPPGSGCQKPPTSPAVGHRRSPDPRTGRCSPPRPPHR